jgi:hypothetical protein
MHESFYGREREREYLGRREYFFLLQRQVHFLRLSTT